MITVTIRTGQNSSAQPPWFSVRENPPRRGDVIFMKLPDEVPAPPTYTRVDGGCWKWSDGTEMGFPYPAMWFYSSPEGPS